ncbi:MAG: ribonuclease PH [Bdellovibrionales bacterium RIFOXYD12_FULL_39_22]|nr:MAG: ribonuclease PH [Bdellovibrionales bacterium RIFOXYB1_FULL_39_21]OFZ42979.1 MAG: ribonuclease PH [Bdellovibrionales bacterium RIFOXYC12_FULL_39_17]OFZ50935.1 MAG: ribonuclease PH [Bdellovibrionales bacterium RIFOXYC1_FULL_39_130]OFZ74061.1 MAG: ribonuclease PH [Bdellovibrionales bacterium RIFOXYC2_FULL_39_8]OFZ78158.1 MAG: ribonuclease PH [Bdellovibrionales bacterium RIFOXYD1_FULL_39_84]OFZ94026.1 MAG: ribonuclease PH [Bdellovibrionales bacterium RIFOXYD12_FULL_39_22]HLE10478.1 ribonu
MSLIERDTPRKISFTPSINPYAAGSVMAEFGNTKVHITAVIEESVPPFLKGKQQGWVTAEYSMLPSATHTRGKRERNSVGGRTMEIQRLIGRSLRSIIDLKKIGERSLTIDCDVLVADGGTRTTSISGAYVALALAVKKLMGDGIITENPLREPVAAISIGINNNGKIIADLNYNEDSTCDTDMNIVMTKNGRFIEIQGTAEKEPFNREQLNAILDCANNALKSVFDAQDLALQ